jgi:hypothetical protein
MADLDNKIKFLTSPGSDIVNNIDRLKMRRVDLMKELGQVEQDLTAKEQKLADLPGTLRPLSCFVKHVLVLIYPKPFILFVLFCITL